MNLRATLMVIFIMTFISIVPVWAQLDPNFYISSAIDKPLADHAEWCEYMKIQCEGIFTQLVVQTDPSKDGGLDELENNLVNHLLVNNITPYIDLEIAGIVNNTTRDQIDAVFASASLVQGMMDWMDVYRRRMEALGQDLKIQRYRLRNEANTWGHITPEDYYYQFHKFKPLFDAYMPEGSKLVISLAGSEVSGGDRDYRLYLERMLLEHKNYHLGEPLPFDGMDLHGYHTRYNYYSEMYYEVRKVFHSVFGEGIGDSLFYQLDFWALESTGINHGMCQTVWSSCIFEYNSDLDAARHVIKIITNDLNIPNLRFVNMISRVRGEWEKRFNDGLFAMSSIYDHGEALFDKGYETPTGAVEPIRRFTHAIHHYHPDTSVEAVFSSTSLKRYQFKSDFDVYRLIVWKDYGNKPETFFVSVPATWTGDVDIVDLISGETTQTPILPNHFIQASVFDNPLLVKPHISAGTVRRSSASDIRSGVSDLDPWGSGDWESTTYIANPGDSTLYASLSAYHQDGSDVDFPYDLEIPGKGVIAFKFDEYLPSFRGAAVVDSSSSVKGYSKSLLVTADGTNQAAACPIITVPEESDYYKYLSTDWEVYSNENGEMINQLILTNGRDISQTADISVYDKDGSLLELNSVNIASNNQYIMNIGSIFTSYACGKVEVYCQQGVTGQITRFFLGDDDSISLWSEEPLFTDLELIKEIEIKSLTIDDAETFNRIIVTNPYKDTITGTLFTYDSSDILIESSTISIPGDETIELTPEENVASMVFKLDEGVKVFGRQEVTVNDETGEYIVSKSINPDTLLPGRLFLPYYIVDLVSDEIKTTTIRINNTNKYDTTAYLRLYTTDGNSIPVTDSKILIGAGTVQKINLKDYLPAGTQFAEGTLEFEISAQSGLTAEADFLFSNTQQQSGYTFSVALDQLSQ